MSTGGAAWREVDVVRLRDAARAPATDHVAAEAPLDIRLHGESFVMTMRTPGDDEALAAGFLLSEGVVTSPADIGSILQRRQADGTAEHVVDVALRGVALARLPEVLAGRRHVGATSACGVCGRPSVDALAFTAAPIDAGWSMPAEVLTTLPEVLRERQAVFDRTGGLHAAGLFTNVGELVATAEDVGRHNAVDKVIGRLLLQRALPLTSHVLCVSGRASYELVQKAVVAGIPMLVAVSAPSSLAVDLARERNVTLAGFVRERGCNVYTHPHRIA